MSDKFLEADFKEISATIRHYSGLRYLVIPVFMAIQGGILFAVRNNLPTMLDVYELRIIAITITIGFGIIFIVLERSLDKYLEGLIAIARSKWPQSFWAEVRRTKRLVTNSICMIYILTTVASCGVLWLASTAKPV